tara:strand:- start:2921 stop:3604 length:684 start_codon:yes stop_codon:yes gene_type:complete
MSELPLVTCVVPCFNGEAFLAEALQSALEQTHRHMEVIVVDDGSVDASADVARQFSDAGVRLLQQSNGGAASARNLGVENARGAYIAFLDADDLWLPDKVERQLRVLAENRKLGQCMTLMQNFWIEALAHEAKANPALEQPQPGPGSSFLAHRQVFEEVGLLNPTLCDRDIQEWTMRARLHGWNTHLIEDVMARRRIHGNNLSRRRATGENELLDLASNLLLRKRTG